MFGIGKKKAKGIKLSKVLTKQERSDLIIYLTATSILGSPESIRDACRGILPAVQADEPLIPDVMQGLFNICNTMINATHLFPSQARQAQTIASKLNKLL